MDSCYQNNLSQSQKKCIEKTIDNVITLSSRLKPQQCILNGEFVESINGAYKSEVIGNTSNKTYSTAHKNDTEAQLREEAVTMDDNKILEKYMDKIDQDRRDMEQRLTEDRRESEKRIEEQRRLSEERIEKKFNDIIGVVEKTNVKIDSKIDNLSEKVDSTNKWIIGLCITTILSIAGMAISIILTR